MGQYYKPIFLKDDKRTPLAHAYSHDFKEEHKCHDGTTYTSGTGLKLMEHSWMKNKFVGFIEEMLTPGKAFYKSPLVWAGDYADCEFFETLPKETVLALIKDGDSLEGLQARGANLDSIADVSSPKILPTVDTIEYKILPAAQTRYIVNHDKKEFVDKNKCKADSDGWKIHPLPLLTCEGNGRGGGDFRGDERGLVGRWARNVISVERSKRLIPKDYTEIVFDLVE